MYLFQVIPDLVLIISEKSDILYPVNRLWMLVGPAIGGVPAGALFYLEE